MAARSAAAATAACHALRRALRVDKLLAQASRLRGCYDCCFLGSAGGSSTTSAAVGAVVLCAVAAFPRAAAFFLPLVASTSLCCAAAWLFAADAAKEEAAGGGVEVIVRECGRGKVGPEPGLLQVIGDANASAYGAGAGRGVQVGCFLRRSARCGVDEDGDEVVFAGTLAPRCAAGGVGGGGGGELPGTLEEEELAALRVDSLAQGVWDSYFGGWSRWHDAYAAY